MLQTDQPVDAVLFHSSLQFVAFLERIERFPQAMELRERSYKLLDAHAGDRVQVFARKG